MAVEGTREAPLSDTHPRIRALQVNAWRQMAPEAKLAAVSELIRATEELARAGIRMRHPQSSESEIELRLIALRLDRQAMIRHFGWDPEREGY